MLLSYFYLDRSLVVEIDSHFSSRFCDAVIGVLASSSARPSLLSNSIDLDVLRSPD
jgi:hypothetical protein